MLIELLVPTPVPERWHSQALAAQTAFTGKKIDCQIHHINWDNTA
jgi:hypothetical protein